MIDTRDLRLSGPADAPAPPPAPAPAAEPAVQFDAGMPYEVGAPPAAGAGFWDVAGAAWTAETIRTDAWGYRARQRRTLSGQMYDLLPQEAKARIAGRQWDYENNWVPFEQMVLDEAARARAADPQAWAQYPASREEFDARLLDERKAEFEEAQAVLDQPGGGLAEFLGSSARAMTDEVNLLLAPLGLEGSAMKVIGSQAVLGGLSEAAVLPREFETAREMGQPDPNAWQRIGLGAAMAGGLTGLLVGAGRAFRWWTDRRLATRDLTPPGGDALDTELRVDAAEGELRGNPTVQERMAPPAAPMRTEAPAGPVEFDFGARGNASPRTNRVGYVYGRFIEMGYDPHVAAGLTANFMQESGPSLNTRAVGDGGASIGLAQWNGGRRQNLERFAARRGTSPDDLDTQIAFVDWELKNTEAAAWTQISRATTAREAALAVSQHYERPGMPANARRVAYAEAIDRQWQAGEVPKWDGATVLPEGGAPYQPYTGTSRGYTGEGQIAVGDEFRIDVEYQVVDLGTLTRASGELQPRDRTRVASDAWIADTAARLDPAQLMPAPTADRGAPLVGPDNVIESGNGRIGAIERAYALYPDRAQAYRQQIEAAGFVIPDGIERPVLIARRKTDWTPEQRRRAVVAAQDSGVAAMTPAELAAVTGRALTPTTLERLDLSAPVGDAANGGFQRAVMDLLPRSARNALYDAAGGMNAYGKRQLGEALFAMAWPDPGLLARFIEGDAGELRDLLTALGRSAPAWAQLKADIAAGLVRAEFDISAHVTDAARIVMMARDLSRTANKPIAKALAETLEAVDQISGPWAPLTAALVKKFTRDGRAVPEEKVVAFLTDYAREARLAGREGGMFGGPSPRDVLVKLDPDTFGGLPEDLGQARGYAVKQAQPLRDLPDQGFDQGAASPEAEAADAAMAEDLLAPPVSAEPPVTPPAAPGRPAMAPMGQVRRMASEQPFETLEQAFQLAAKAQERLTVEGARIARELGVIWKDPGLKDQGEAAAKITRKRYSGPKDLTDLSRGGLILDRAEQADDLAERFASAFEVVDEGWVRNEVGYVDRKLVLRHPDGMLSEVQIWTRDMFEAKAVGTKVYNRRRKLPPGDEKDALIAREIEIYSAAAAGTKDITFSSDGISAAPMLHPNRSLRTASDGSRESTAAVLDTSSASTLTQGAPGDSWASAKNPPDGALNRAAGRPSQLEYDSSFTGNVPSVDIPSMGTGGQAVNAAVSDADAATRRALDQLHAEFGDMVLELPDGSPATVREVLADLDEDGRLDDLIDACRGGP